MMHFRLLFFLCVVLLPTASLAGASPGNSLLTEIETKASSNRSISCGFIQHTHLQMFDEVLTSHVTFSFVTPSALRWEYTTPFKAGFILNGDDGKEWDEASGETRTFTTSSAPHIKIVAEQITAWATFDMQWLRSRYEITQLNASPVTLELRPKSLGARDFLHHLKVTFTDDKTGVKELELHEPEGDFTRILFINPVINGTVSPETFSIVQ